MSSDTLAAPTSVEAVADVLRAAAADGATIDIAGAGTKRGWGNVVPAAGVTIDTRRLDRVLHHAAGDLVVSVQAGVRLRDLQGELAGARQWLALDPPYSEATVGGVVAAAVSGPRRLRWGTPRDLVIGMTVVLADGTVARSGGSVVKNVAGYDLGKLFTGSFGTLGVIAEITFRLHPRPAALRVVSIRPDDPDTAVRAVRASGTQPSAVEWDGTTLTVVIEGSAPAAQAQAEQLIGRVGGWVGRDLPADFGRLPFAAGSGQVGLKVTHRLGGFGRALGAVGEALPQARIRAHAGSGVIWVGYDTADLAPVAQLRRAVGALDGQVVVVAAPDELRQGFDVWGPVRGLAVMRRIKEQFDPQGRMSPGRFAGGI